MARKPITISVPETMQRYIEDRVKASCFGTVSEYIRELVREDRQRQLDRVKNVAHYPSGEMPYGSRRM